MHRNKTTTLIMPSYNEEIGIEKIFKKLPKIIDEIIVVDNNSIDNSVKIAKENGAKVINESRQGYGSAYLAGFKQCKNDIIITLDSDGSYLPEDIPYLLKELSDSKVDFISGSRFPLKNSRSMKTLNKLGNFILTIVFNFFTKSKIKDSQSGMWLFYRSVLNDMNLSCYDMGFSEEIKMEAILSKKIKFKEVKINYRERAGEVKLRKWRDGFLNMCFLVKKYLEIKKRKGNNKV